MFSAGIGKQTARTISVRCEPVALERPVDGGVDGVHQQSDVALVRADHRGVDPRRVVVPTMEASMQSNLTHT